MASNLPDRPRLDVGLVDLVDDIDLVLCDVWGVIHNGERHHPAAVEALQAFRRRGGTVVLVTNAPAPKGQVQRRMDRLGVPRDAYDDIATSGDVTSGMIADAGGPAVATIGPSWETAILGEAGRALGRTLTAASLDAADLVVCIGLDEVRGHPDDYLPDLQRMRARNLDLICANPDIVVGVGDTLVYCAGAIAERYEAMGGRVVHAGKPFPAIYARALAMAETVRGRATPAERVLAIGDAMATDVKGAAAQGFRALFVTSGIHRAALHGDASGLDADALRQFLGTYDVAPHAVTPTLAWTAEETLI